MLRFALDVKAKAGARTGNVPEKKQKLEVLGGNSVPKEFTTTPIFNQSFKALISAEQNVTD